MKALGTAKLVQTTNDAGAVVKAWDLRPFGGNLLHLGLVSSPLPPQGTTTDRTLPNGRVLRIDTSSGAVFEVESGDEAPAVGPPGGVPMKGPGVLAGGRGLAIIVGILFAFWKLRGKRRR